MTLTHNQPPDHEQIIWTANPHYLTQLKYILLGLTLLPLGIGIFLLLKAHNNITYTNYALTDHAIYKQHGWLTTKTERIPLTQIHNLNTTTSLIEKHTNHGTITINDTTLNAIPQPKKKQQLIQNHQPSTEDITTQLKQTKSNLQKLTNTIKQPLPQSSNEEAEEPEEEPDPEETKPSGSSQSRSQRMAQRRKTD